MHPAGLEAYIDDWTFDWKILSIAPGLCPAFISGPCPCFSEAPNRKQSIARQPCGRLLRFLSWLYLHIFTGFAALLYHSDFAPCKASLANLLPSLSLYLALSAVGLIITSLFSLRCPIYPARRNDANYPASVGWCLRDQRKCLGRQQYSPRRRQMRQNAASCCWLRRHF